MRRLLAILAAFLLLAARPAPTVVAAPETQPTEWRVKVPGDCLVTIDPAALPELPANRRWALYAPGLGSHRVAGDPEARLRFAVWGEHGSAGVAPRTLTLSAVDSSGVSLPPAPIVDDGATALETFVWDEDLVFGPVAAADAKVYDARVPDWYLARLEPNGTAEIPVALPAPGPADGATVTVRVAIVGTLDEPVALHAAWGGTDLGETSVASARGGATLTFTTSAADVAAATSLRIEDRSPAPPPPQALDVSDDRGVVWIDSVTVETVMKPHPGPRLAIPDRPRRRLVPLDATSLLVAHAPAKDWGALAQPMAMLVVATKETMAGATRLAAHRTAHGIPTLVVGISELVDVWPGDQDVVAPFLRQVARAGGTPRFVLLAGDAARDRTDIVPWENIPTTYARTKYNGATAADRLFTLPEGKRSGGPAIGRLPFRTAAEMDAYVDRVIAWEAKPKPDPTRRLLRFVTSEARFGPQADALIERLFSQILAQSIPPSFETEVTYASVTSPFCWPPHEFNEKVVRDLNDGSLYFTYVGHGWADGFDALHVGRERYPILRSQDVPQVDVLGTPPAMFVIACTTAQFDDPDHDSVGELLLRRPNGPLAYFGATRICHPIFNSLAGVSLAENLLLGSDRRLGERIRDAVDAVVEPKEKDTRRALIEVAEKMALGPDEDFQRLYREGQAMYVLLGDPALKLPLPAADLDVAAKTTEKGLSIAVTGSFPAGTEVHVSVETPRDAPVAGLAPLPGSPSDPKSAEVMKANHARANDKALWRKTLSGGAGGVGAEAEVPEAWRGKRLHVKAWAVFGDDVHQGSATTAGS